MNNHNLKHILYDRYKQDDFYKMLKALTSHNFPNEEIEISYNISIVLYKIKA